MNNEREAFERTIVRLGNMDESEHEHIYPDETANLMWAVWQAARQSAGSEIEALKHDLARALANHAADLSAGATGREASRKLCGLVTLNGTQKCIKEPCACAPIGDNGAALTDRAMACFREALVERIWSVTAGEISEILQRARALLARASAKGE